MKIKIGWLFVTVLVLTSCGGTRSMRTAKTAVKADASFSVKESLLPAEQQRKYDYFFLEAMRMKEKNEYDAAFGLLQHCLDINPNASSALYEISQYYMFLRQVPQGQAALNRRWLLLLIISGIARGWLACISNRTSWIRL